MHLVRTFYRKLPHRVFNSVTNLRSLLNLGAFGKIRLYRHGELILLKNALSSPESSDLFIARRERLFLYTDGINTRLNSLAEQYLIVLEDLDSNDYVIDIGSNIGEFSKFLKENGCSNFLCIEPENLEADACDRNIFQGKKFTVRKCLWEYTGTVRFYRHNKTGDSSATPNDLNWPNDDVACITLDDLVSERGIDIIGIIKLEAEGSEPEVLRGGLKTILRTKWIVADLGHERGPAQESTFIGVNQILIEHGFELVSMGGLGLRESYKYRNMELT